ncbi:MAG: DUF3048 domain-containing protein [Butyrivibrio sp.]|nr:DUF3048 domain-containing protein [Butyrivibrio sp.]
MKKLQVMLLAALTATMIFGCGKSSNDAITGISAEKIQSSTQAASASDTAGTASSEDVPPAAGMVRSPFTNEWEDESVAKTRPLAVMYPINKEAQPQYGLSNVAVFYEIMEEGSMSRQMGILEDWQKLDRIGNIRSIRDYFVYAALEYDPIIIHFGGPELYVKDILTREDVQNLNGVGGVMGSAYGAFYRVPAGSTSEHTAFTDGKHVVAAAKEAGFQLEHRDNYYGKPHFQFTNESSPNTLSAYSDAVDATDIDMAGCYPVTKSALKYNADDHLYYKTLYGQKQVDAETKEQLSFTNVLIERAYYEVRDAHGYLAFQMHDTTRDGYFITQGKMIHVTWKKEAIGNTEPDYSPTRFFDDNGKEITVNTGRTMVFVIEEDNTFKVNGEVVKYRN